jgi:hypothetical protein
MKWEIGRFRQDQDPEWEILDADVEANNEDSALNQWLSDQEASVEVGVYGARAPGDDWKLRQLSDRSGFHPIDVP